MQLPFAHAAVGLSQEDTMAATAHPVVLRSWGTDSAEALDEVSQAALGRRVRRAARRGAQEARIGIVGGTADPLQDGGEWTVVRQAGFASHARLTRRARVALQTGLALALGVAALFGCGSNAPSTVWDGYLAHLVLWDNPLAAGTLTPLMSIA